MDPPITDLDELQTWIQTIAQDSILQPSDRALIFITTILNGELLAV